MFKNRLFLTCLLGLINLCSQTAQGGRNKKRKSQRQRQQAEQARRAASRADQLQQHRQLQAAEEAMADDDLSSGRDAGSGSVVQIDRQPMASHASMAAAKDADPETIAAEMLPMVIRNVTHTRPPCIAPQAQAMVFFEILSNREEHEQYLILEQLFLQALQADADVDLKVISIGIIITLKQLIEDHPEFSSPILIFFLRYKNICEQLLQSNLQRDMILLFSKIARTTHKHNQELFAINFMLIKRIITPHRNASDCFDEEFFAPFSTMQAAAPDIFHCLFAFAGKDDAKLHTLVTTLLKILQTYSFEYGEIVLDFLKSPARSPLLNTLLTTANLRPETLKMFTSIMRRIPREEYDNIKSSIEALLAPFDDAIAIFRLSLRQR